mgnify:CR=1 FL=1
MNTADIVIICILAAAVGQGRGNGLYSQAPQKRQVYRLLRQLCRLRRIVKQQKR